MIPILTGFDMIPMRAFGEFLPIAWTRSRTMVALVLNRSSLVIPGFRGTPAGMITTSTFVTAACDRKIVGLAFEWDTREDGNGRGSHLHPTGRCR